LNLEGHADGLKFLIRDRDRQHLFAQLNPVTLAP
jgi:hypothetical protein